MTPDSASPPRDRLDPLQPTELYFYELFSAAPLPGFLLSQEVSMESCAALIAKAKTHGLRLTYVTLLVRAVGLALHRMGPEHVMTNSRHRLTPGRVDITVPVGGTGVSFCPLSMHLLDVGRSNLQDVASEMTRQAEALRRPQPEVLRQLDRFGPLLRIGWLRRKVIRRFVTNIRWRQRHMGTVQVSCLPTVDFFAPLNPFVGTIIGMGAVRQRPAVEKGQLVVKLAANVAATFDHRVWNGLGASKFLHDVQQILSSGELESEIHYLGQETSVTV
ncbi:MAG: 2-oxo acid dehydrogenase subunit E2 [Bryobacteraceae bacterium]|nr:2-oxo acid dehydrogenase subunit E2 [Bryobacteraceae bacterium]